MKTKLLLLFATVLFLSSCHPNLSDVLEDPNMDAQFDFVPNDECALYYRLYLKHNDGSYYYFDDEACYDDIIQQLLFAELVAVSMVLKDYTEDQIENALQYVKYLPIQDEDVDPQIKEILNRVYYDTKDVAIYDSEDGYGYRKYTYGDGYHIRLYRDTDHDGVISIH